VTSSVTALESATWINVNVDDKILIENLEKKF